MTTLSGHLVASHHSFQRSLIGPFGVQVGQNNLVQTSDNAFFDPTMHGNFGKSVADMSFMSSMSGSQEMSEATANQIAMLQAKLDKKLGPEYVSQRPGNGGMKLTYVEGWKVINLANEVFGFNGWSSSITSLTTDFIDYHEQSQRYNVGVTAVVRVTLRDGTFHEDIGYGILENSRQKGAALDKCKKEAVTDGVKRALRNFGNVLGNCLYDKQYINEIVKIKVPPAKFDRSALHRRPEFDELNTSSGPVAGPSRVPTPQTPLPTTNQPINKPASSVPPHIRRDFKSNTSSSATPVPSRGLPTPRTTPLIPTTNPGKPPSHSFAPAAAPLPSAMPLNKGKAPNDTFHHIAPPDSSRPIDREDSSVHYFDSDDCDDAMFAELDIGDESVREEGILDGLHAEQASKEKQTLSVQTSTKVLNTLPLPDASAYMADPSRSGAVTGVSHSSTVASRTTLSAGSIPQSVNIEPHPRHDVIDHADTSTARVPAPDSASRRRAAILRAISENQAEADNAAEENDRQRQMMPPPTSNSALTSATSMQIDPKPSVSRPHASVGGFHFPEGMDTNQAKPARRPNALSTDSSLTPSAGSKRSAEGFDRRAPPTGPGMGLSAGGVGSRGGSGEHGINKRMRI